MTIVATFFACGSGLVAPESDTTVDSVVRPPVTPILVETFAAQTHHYSSFGYSPDGTCLTGYYAAQINNDGNGAATAHCLDSAHQLAAPIFSKSINLTEAQMTELRSCASDHPLADVDFANVDGTLGACGADGDVYDMAIVENGTTYAFQIDTNACGVFPEHLKALMHCLGAAGLFPGGSVGL